VNDGARIIVGPEGTALATGLPGGIEHEVVDEKLAAAFEQLAQGSSLVDFHPWKVAPGLAQFIS
jgi:hypothetical protein